MYHQIRNDITMAYEKGQLPNSRGLKGTTFRCEMVFVLNFTPNFFASILRWKIGCKENQVPKEVFVRSGPHHLFPESGHL